MVVNHPGPGDSAAPVQSIQVEYGRRKPQPGSLTTDPESLLRTIETMAAMDQAHQLEIVITGETIITSVREPPPTTGRFAALADLLRDLIFVRDTLAVPLLVPETWTGPDQIALRAAAALLRGEETPISIDSYSWVGSPEDARTVLAACLADGGIVDEAPLANFTFTFARNTLHIAPLYARVPRIALANASAVQAALDRNDEEIPIELVPWPGTGAIGRMTPFPTDTNPTHPADVAAQ